jgi:hypothetical protein
LRRLGPSCVAWGQASGCDLAKFKEANDKHISDAEEQLKALQSECFTMTQLIADAAVQS